MRDIDEFLATTDGRWEGIARAQAAIRADAEDRVIDHRWSQGFWAADVQPYSAERSGVPRPRLRRKRPPDVERWCEYGFDEHERCVLVREPSYGSAYRDWVFVHADGSSEVLEFTRLQDWERRPGDEEYRLAAFEQHRYDEHGRLAFWARQVRNERSSGVESRWWWEEPVYGPGGRVERIVEYRPVFGDAYADLHVGETAVLSNEFSYDDAGDLVTIRLTHPEGEQVLWRRRPASLAPALRKVENTLADALTAWAREHWPDEPTYCLGLSYDLECPLSLLVAIGTDRERQAMLAEPGEFGVALELWSPAEFEISPAFSPEDDDPAYAEAAALLQQEWRLTDDDRAGFKLLARVAKRLNAAGFEDLPRTIDFVVFAIDPDIPDQAHIERHLRACIPKDIFKDLKRRGLFFVEP